MNNVVRLRRMLDELTWTEQVPDLSHLLRREDSPRREELLPLPMTMAQGKLIQEEVLRRNDVTSQATLLIRHIGTRIGECDDLSCE